MKLLRKAPPIVLMVWPYLLIGVLYLFSLLGSDTASLIFRIYCVLTVAVYALNIWNACTLRDEKQLARWSMAVKLVHIPFYLLVFCVGVVFAGAMVVPALLFLSPFILLLLAAGDWLLLLTSSVYGISAAVQAAVRGRIPKADAVVCGVLHCFFVLDVVGAALLFCRLRKTDAPLSR